MNGDKMVRCLESALHNLVRIVNDFAEDYPEEMGGRFGGHFVLQKVGGNQPLISTPLHIPGTEVDEDRANGFKVNAEEKAVRLSRLAKEENHLTSWQSRDFENKKYGGAIVCGGFVFSFSGLPEHFDELLMTTVAKDVLGGVLSRDIAEISGNPLINQAA